MSREVTFDTTDLEELIALLADSAAPTSAASDHVPRPSKVRKMFAMRACRSSIMIGKNLSLTQMKKLVRRMGEVDKPWNCPHGRPTMRHILGLHAWKGGREGDGLVGPGNDEGGDVVPWGSWLQSLKREFGHEAVAEDPSQEDGEANDEDYDQEDDVEDDEGPDEEQDEGIREDDVAVSSLDLHNRFARSD